MSSSVPPLRSGLELLRREGDDRFPALLNDPDLGQRVRLDTTGQRVAAVLDREQSLAEVADRAGLDPETAGRAIDLLERAYMLDTEESRAFAASAGATRRWQATDADEVPLIIREDAKFSCTMCGSCCGGHNIGPVAESVLDGLEDHGAELLVATGTKKGLFFSLPTQPPPGAGEAPSDASQGHIVCHSSRGSCVFLDEERRCIIHSRFGGEKKPGVCQLFPYQFVATPDGIAVSLQMECRGFIEAREGRPLAEQEADLRKLLRTIRPRPVRPLVMVDGAHPLAWPAYKEVETELHAAVEAHPEAPLSGLLAMRDVLERRRGPEPDRTAAADRVGVTELREDLDNLLSALYDMLGALHVVFSQADERSIVHTEGLELLATALAGMRPDMGRVVRPLDRADQRSLFADMAHNHLVDKDLCTPRTLVVGLARLSFSWFCIKALAFHRARQVKRRHLVAQDVLDSMVVVRFLLRNTALLDALKQHDGELVSLFYDRLPALLERGRELPDDDRVLELYKF